MRGTARLSEVPPPQEPSRPRRVRLARLGSMPSPTARIAIIAVAIAWIPTALLSAGHGFDALQSFLTDWAAQSRLLVVIPVLLITEPALAASLLTIARKFRDEGLVKEEDSPRFDAALRSFDRCGDTLIVRGVMVVLVYLFVASTISIIATSPLMSWCFGPHGISTLSLAGSWYALVGLPITLLALLRWVWRQMIWFWFLVAVSNMNLRLIPAHPDRAGGLIFVEQCMRRYTPFCFAVGMIVAGGVANRVLYLRQSIASFRYMPLIVISIVVPLCAGPLCVFWGTLRRTRSRGIFQYGALATSMGRQFEQKWLASPNKPRDDALAMTDFSATIDLYSIVANVQQTKVFPIGMRSIGRLAGAALAPAIPLALIVLPFDLIVKEALKFLL
jgi:hypothetical protein